MFFIPIYIFKNSSCWIFLVSPCRILTLCDPRTRARLCCLTHSQRPTVFLLSAHPQTSEQPPRQMGYDGRSISAAALWPIWTVPRGHLCSHCSQSDGRREFNCFQISNAHELMKSGPGRLPSQWLTRWKNYCCANICFWIQLHGKFKAAEKVQLSK